MIGNGHVEAADLGITCKLAATKPPYTNYRLYRKEMGKEITRLLPHKTEMTRLLPHKTTPWLLR